MGIEPQQHQDDEDRHLVHPMGRIGENSTLVGGYSRTLHWLICDPLGIIEGLPVVAAQLQETLSIVNIVRLRAYRLTGGDAGKLLTKDASLGDLRSSNCPS
jgi:hypothetical protein